jgi:hypothetical protein
MAFEVTAAPAHDGVDATIVTANAPFAMLLDLVRGDMRVGSEVGGDPHTVIGPQTLSCSTITS